MTCGDLHFAYEPTLDHHWKLRFSWFFDGSFILIDRLHAIVMIFTLSPLPAVTLRALQCLKVVRCTMDSSTQIKRWRILYLNDRIPMASPMGRSRSKRNGVEPTNTNKYKPLCVRAFEHALYMHPPLRPPSVGSRFADHLGYSSRKDVFIRNKVKVICSG